MPQQPGGPSQAGSGGAGDSTSSNGSAGGAGGAAGAGGAGGGASSLEGEHRMFLCRMNVSRNARRQMRFGDQKVSVNTLRRKIKSNILKYIKCGCRTAIISYKICS